MENRIKNDLRIDKRLRALNLLSILRSFLILFSIYLSFLYFPLNTGSFFSTNALVAFL